MLSPSLLSANFFDLKTDLELLQILGIKYLHHDIMDGHFVPNLTFGYPIVKNVIESTLFQHDLHFMVKEPEKIIPVYLNLKPWMVTFHLEATVHPQRLVTVIQAAGVKAGVVLNPATPTDSLPYLLPYLDMVLLMSVNPGFSGQSFIYPVKDKIKKVRELIDASENNIILALDGGVDTSNIAELKELGVDYFVSGSGVFKNREIEKNVKALQEKLKK
jgi:ribulose-phosphate 3-epimerase